MKKIAYALIAAGMSLSFSVFAAPAAVPADGVVTAGATGLCPQLSEQVKINLSSNVSGAFNCDEASNTITIATCHNAGSRLPSLKCAQIGTDPTTNAPIFNDDQCDAQKVADGESIEGTPDYRGFFAQTSGGSVAPAFLGGQCAGSVLTSHAKIGG